MPNGLMIMMITNFRASSEVPKRFFHLDTGFLLTCFHLRILYLVTCLVLDTFKSASLELGKDKRAQAGTYKAQGPILCEPSIGRVIDWINTACLSARSGDYARAPAAVELLG